MTKRRAPVEARLRRLDSLLLESRLDAALLSSFEAVSYFAGIHLFTQALVPDRAAYTLVRPGGEATLVVCDIEESLVRAQTPLPDVRVYVEFAEQPSETVADLARELGAQRIGVEARRLPAATAHALEAAGLEIVAVDDDVDAVQMVKDVAEVDSLEAAARATQAAIAKAVAETSAGATERDLAVRITANVVGRGGDPIFLVLGAGERAMLAHAEATDRLLRPGDVIRIDVGARFKLGVLGDLARTAVVGEAGERREQIHAAVRAAQDETFALIEPGRPVCELYHRCKRTVEAAGIPFSMPHIGHGLGIGLHEAPHIHPANETPLAAGMVINIEPFVVLREHEEAYHVEDLVLVTESGYRLLSSPEDRLLRLEAQ